MVAWLTKIQRDLQEGDKSGYYVHEETLPERPARYGDLDNSLPKALARLLENKGIHRLYSHQAEAINWLSEGRNVIISTSTASGKSLCYHLPALSSLLTDRRAKVMYVFPTKALAHDQLDSLRSLVPAGSPIVANTYDGDTPKESRRNIRRNSSIIVTNPDMLHAAVLPYHRGWTDFLRNLRFVVIDEAHYYRGVLGAHVAMIIRRLRRICRELGADPQFVLCSATLSNATEHAEKMVGLPFVSVERDGSPSGSREFVFWNPTVYSDAEEGRASINMEAAEITARLLERGIRTMTFVRSRSGVERVCDLTRRCSRVRLMEPCTHTERDILLTTDGTPNGAFRMARSWSCDDQRYGVGGGCWWLGCNCDHRISGNRVERLATGRAKWSCSDSSPLSAGSSRPPGRPVLHEAPRCLLQRTVRECPYHNFQPAHPGRPSQVRRIRVTVVPTGFRTVR